MRNILLMVLCFLVIASPVAASFPCSTDSSAGMLTCSGCENMGVILIKSVPTGASITINPGQSTTFTDTSQLSLGQDPGTHTFTVSLSGYTDYSGQYEICSQKMTYATVQLTQAPPVTLGKIRAINTIALQKVTTLPTTTIPAAITTIPDTTSPVTEQATLPIVTGTAVPQTILGSLSITTTPAGAFIFIDGVQRGVSPATIPGLSAETHTVLLKLDGYQDLSAPVTIAAGQTHNYATGMVKNAVLPAKQADMESTTALPTPAVNESGKNSTGKTITPGFEVAAALMAIAAILVMRKRS